MGLRHICYNWIDKKTGRRPHWEEHRNAQQEAVLKVNAERRIEKK